MSGSPKKMVCSNVALEVSLFENVCGVSSKALLQDLKLEDLTFTPAELRQAENKGKRDGTSLPFNTWFLHRVISYNYLNPPRI